MMKTKSDALKTLVPVMTAFFIMGFVDITGIAANHVKVDFNLSDTLANLFASLVFVWFLLLSVPAGMLIDRIGRKKTVLISLIFTVISLLLPFLHYSLPMMAVSFCLLGISNTFMQVSLNPLLSNVVSENKYPAALTFGQSIKTIASFLGPVITGWAVLRAGGWQMIYPLFAFIGILGLIFLAKSKIEEMPVKKRASGYKECFSLLGDKMIMMCFLCIICHVGIDVGVNITAPKILMEKSGIPLSSAGMAASVYFLFKIAGALAGSLVLPRRPAKEIFIISIVCMAAGAAGLFAAQTKPFIYACIAVMGIGNANVFSIIFSQALMAKPENKNEISGLMIMGVSGGALFPALAGFASDFAASQAGATAVAAIGILCLSGLVPKIRTTH